MSSFDSLRRRVQRGLFTCLPAQVSHLSWDAATIADYQLSRLRALLGYAMDRSPFHARRLAGLDPGRTAASPSWSTSGTGRCRLAPRPPGCW